MIKSSIRNSKKGNELLVGDLGEIYAHIIPTPPKTETNALPYSDYLRLDGTGVTSMLANGAIDNKDFHIKALKNYDIYINTIQVVVADAGSIMNKFGNLPVLTNGIEFYYFNQKTGKYTIEQSIKTNFEFLRISNFEPAFGTANDAFMLTNVSGASEAYVINIDLEDVFGLQWGLKLQSNSLDRVGFIIKDDITGLDLMDCKVYGIKI